MSLSQSDHRFGFLTVFAENKNNKKLLKLGFNWYQSYKTHNIVKRNDFSVLILTV